MVIEREKETIEAHRAPIAWSPSPGAWSARKRLARRRRSESERTFGGVETSLKGFGLTLDTFADGAREPIEGQSVFVLDDHGEPQEGGVGRESVGAREADEGGGGGRVELDGGFEVASLHEPVAAVATAAGGRRSRGGGRARGELGGEVGPEEVGEGRGRGLLDVAGEQVGEEERGGIGGGLEDGEAVAEARASLQDEDAQDGEGLSWCGGEARERLGSFELWGLGAFEGEGEQLVVEGFADAPGSVGVLLEPEAIQLDPGPVNGGCVGGEHGTSLAQR
jgi:hypothetical protein